MLTIYRRFKDEAGKWKVQSIKEGRGIKTGTITGPFLVRINVAGRQVPRALHSTTFAEARIEANESEKLFEAQSKWLTVADLDSKDNVHRIPVKSVVEIYIEQKSGRSKKTKQQYQRTLEEFLASLAEQKVRFLDEITVDVLRKYKTYLEKEGYAGKTVDTRINIVYFMLKKNDVSARIPADEMPTVEEEAPAPYTDEELKKLFAHMDDEEKLRYRFFLGSACREQEVQYASWQDIDWTRKEYYVRKKEDVGFTPKNHESRRVPLPDSLMAELKERKKNAPHPRWIFVNRDGNPDGHMLKKLKRISLAAGGNCGHCRTTVTKGKYESKREVEVTCATDPVCQHVKLHRFRKTRATQWLRGGIDMNTLRQWLGHKKLETTQKYLGVQDSTALRANINSSFGD